MSSLTIYLGSLSPPSSSNGDENTIRQAASLGAASKQTAAATSSGLTRLDIHVKASDLSESWSPMDLASFALQTNAEVSVHVQQEGATVADLETIHTAFVLAGLVASGERRCDEKDGQATTRIVTAVRKPSQSVTVAALKKNQQPAVALDDNDLIDEDNLLADSSNLLAPPPAMSAVPTKGGDDCSGRKPCDDCTCGRADQEGQNEKPAAAQPIKTSSCGKCGLGDAFRCASCPYLGKPAFKPGEEHLVLDLQDDL